MRGRRRSICIVMRSAMIAGLNAEKWSRGDVENKGGSIPPTPHPALQGRYDLGRSSEVKYRA